MPRISDHSNVERLSNPAQLGLRHQGRRILRARLPSPTAPRPFSPRARVYRLLCSFMVIVEVEIETREREREHRLRATSRVRVPKILVIAARMPASSRQSQGRSQYFLLFAIPQFQPPSVVGSKKALEGNRVISSWSWSLQISRAEYNKFTGPGRPPMQKAFIKSFWGLGC